MDFEGCRKGRIQAIEPWWPEGKPVGLVAWWPGGRLVAVGLVAWRSRGCLVAWTPGGLEAWSSESSPGHRKLSNPILLKGM